MVNKSIKKILILVPGKNARGGITGYYETLGKYFSLSVEYFERGSRNWPKRENFFLVLFRFIKDAFCFYKKLRTGDYTIIQTTTSFSPHSIIRDSIFLLIAQRFDVKIIVFFHGWNINFAKTIETKFLKIFKQIYFKSDAIIDLSEVNKESLISWGFTKRIYIETTVVDSKLVGELNHTDIKNKFLLNQNRIVLLFLARIEKEKGIYEAIDTFSILKMKYPFIEMIIAGDGSEEKACGQYVKKRNLEDINFVGYVSGTEKREVFIRSHIYILPSYSEGLPTTLLEAMAFGLPAITRPVGGIPDIFINGQNGFYDESKDPIIFARLVENLILDRDLMNKISMNNFIYAQNRFSSSKVVERVEKIFTDISLG